MKKKVTIDEVEYIAKLANISLSAEETNKYCKEIESILEYVEQISEIDTSEVNYQSHVELKNIYRDDIPKESLRSNDVVGQTKNNKSSIVIPKVINKDEE